MFTHLIFEISPVRILDILGQVAEKCKVRIASG
jgi:hypothetical protein